MSITHPTHIQRFGNTQIVRTLMNQGTDDAVQKEIMRSIIIFPFPVFYSQISNSFSNDHSFFVNMWRKSIARNHGNFNGGKKALKTVRKVAVSSFQTPSNETSIQREESARAATFSTAAVMPTMKINDIKSDAVQDAIRILQKDGTDSQKFIMKDRLDDFEVSKLSYIT